MHPPENIKEQKQNWWTNGTKNGRKIQNQVAFQTFRLLDADFKKAVNW